MKDNKANFDKLLREYKKQKIDYEQKLKIYHESYNAWWQEVKSNDDCNDEKANDLGLIYDKASSNLDSSKTAYDALAHVVLETYILLQSTKLEIQEEINEKIF